MSRRRSLGGALLLIALISVTVALSVIGTLEERAARTTTTTGTETQLPANTTALPTEATTTPREGNTSTTTLRI